MFMIECLNSWISSKCRLEWVCVSATVLELLRINLCVCVSTEGLLSLCSPQNPQQNAALMSELKTGIAAFLSRGSSWMFSSLRRCFQPFQRKMRKKNNGWFWEHISFESGILMSSPGQGGFNDSMEALPNAPSTLFAEQASGKPRVIAHRSLDSD